MEKKVTLPKKSSPSMEKNVTMAKGRFFVIGGIFSIDEENSYGGGENLLGSGKNFSVDEENCFVAEEKFSIDEENSSAIEKNFFGGEENVSGIGGNLFVD